MNERLARDLLAVMRDIEYEVEAVTGDKQLTYTPKEPSVFLRRTGYRIEYSEQAALFIKLCSLGVIKAKLLPQHDEILREVGIGSHTYSLEVIQPNFNKLIDELSDSSAQGSASEFECSILLKDVKLMMKIGSMAPLQIKNLHEDRTPFKLFSALLSSHGESVLKIDFDVEDLWQVIVKSRLEYLKPFLKFSSKQMSLSPSIVLTIDELEALIPQISAKYRKNFEAALKSLN